MPAARVGVRPHLRRRHPRRSSSASELSTTHPWHPVGVRPQPAAVDRSAGSACQRDVNARSTHGHQRAPTTTHDLGGSEAFDQDECDLDPTSADVDRPAHNPKVAGSNPAPATKKYQLRGPFRSARRASWLPASTRCQRQGLVGAGVRLTLFVGVRRHLVVLVARGCRRSACDERLREPSPADECRWREVDRRVSSGAQPEGCRVLASEGVCLARRGGRVSCQRAEGPSSWHRSVEVRTPDGHPAFARVLSCLIVTRWNSADSACPARPKDLSFRRFRDWRAPRRGNRRRRGGGAGPMWTAATRA